MAFAVPSPSASQGSTPRSPLPALRRAAAGVKDVTVQAASTTAQQVSKLGHATADTVALMGHGAGHAMVATAGQVSRLGQAVGDALTPTPKAARAKPSEALRLRAPSAALARPVSAEAPTGARLVAHDVLACDDLASDDRVEDLERQVILHQRERRRLWYRNAGQGFKTGVVLGAAMGWIPAVALIPTSGSTSLLLWPAAMLGVGVAGATIGATGDFHFSPARPDDVRQHIFSHFGVVPTRRESAALVAKLKAAGVLSRTRFRKLLATEPAARVLADADISVAQQRRGLRILHIIACESARRAPLLAEATVLWREIEALQKKPQDTRSIEEQTRMQSLIEKAAQLNTQLAWLRPEVTA